MTEQKSPLASLIEVMVFAPLGAAFLLREQLPKLSRTGKERAETQVRMARMVGQFAVSAGKKEIERRLAAWRPQPGASAGNVTDTTSSPAPGAPTSAPAATPDAVVSSEGAHTAANGRPNLEMDGPVPSVTDLAIPGYDSLAASQVVERLASLSAEELDLVRRYEAGGRHRRTVLHRIEQLAV